MVHSAQLVQSLWQVVAIQGSEEELQPRVKFTILLNNNLIIILHDLSTFTDNLDYIFDIDCVNMHKFMLPEVLLALIQVLKNVMHISHTHLIPHCEKIHCFILS